MLDPKLITPTDDEIDYVTLRSLLDDFRQRWTTLQRALYLGQIRGHYGLPVSARATALGVSEEELRSELEGLWGVLPWDRSQPDPVPIHRD
jgi:hypothetical protein